MNRIETVKVKNVVIGQGAPKLIVPVMPKTLDSIGTVAAALDGVGFDIVEWRIDHFDAATDVQQVKQAARKLRAALPDSVILFTFRTNKEGGEKAIAPKEYIALNKALVDSGYIDMIDLELFSGAELVKEASAYAHDKGVKVIMSNHDFAKTPPQDEIVKRLRKMQELGADIPKIAVMPNNKSDVLTLLAATLEMYEKYAKRPLITMSMSSMGSISRIAGEAFGSAATFGALGKASAPGQFDVKGLRTILTIVHQAQ